MSLLEKSKSELAVYAFIVLSFFIGLCHGFPLTSIVGDEMFPGAVLRAMEQHTLLPQGLDVLYGTVTYYFTYVFMSGFLVLLLPFLHFSVSALKIFLLDHMYMAYFVGRLVSLVATVGLLYIADLLCRKAGCEKKWRLSLLVLTFSTLIVVGITHTAKVWPVSFLFAFASFYFTWQSIESGERARDHQNRGIFSNFIFWSVICAFISFANFPLMGVMLISIPVIFYYKRNDRRARKTLILSVLIGAAMVLFVYISNSAGIYSQIMSIVQDYTLSEQAQKANVSLLSSFVLNIEKIFLLFPVFILFTLLSFSQKIVVRNRKLLLLSVIYFVVYLLTITVVARWSTSIFSFYRYLFPLPFFWLAALAALEIKVKWYHYILLITSVIFMVFYFRLLSVPTTVNMAVSWVDANINKAGVLVERFGSSDIEIALSQKSAMAISESFCGTICRASRAGLINNNILFDTITEQTSTSSISNLEKSAQEIYLIRDSDASSTNLSLIASFQSGALKNDPDFPPILERIGNYFDPDFFHLERLGRNIYVYKIHK